MASNFERPFDCHLELAFINYDSTHALVLPCRRVLGGWINAGTKERIDVQPTHWREWQQRRSGSALAKASGLVKSVIDWAGLQGGALWRPRLCSLPDQNYADKNENKSDNPKQW